MALWSRIAPIARPPGDRLSAAVAEAIRRPGPLRDRLTAGLYLPPFTAAEPADEREPAALLEEAFRRAAEAEPFLARLRRATRSGAVPEGAPDEIADRAVAAGILDAADAELVRRAAALRREAIRVDELTREEYLAFAPDARRDETVGAFASEP